MAITSGRIADSIPEIRTDPILSKEEEDAAAKAEAMVDAAALVVEDVDSHREMHTFNNSSDDRLHQILQRWDHRQWYPHHRRPQDKSPGTVILINLINRINQPTSTDGGETTTLRGAIITRIRCRSTVRKRRRSRLAAV